jgi:cell division protease FtsH
MDERLGHATYEVERQTFLGLPPTGDVRSLSEDTTRFIDEAVRGIVNAAFERAFGMLKQRRSLLEVGAQQLLKQETLDQSDLKNLATSLPIAAASTVRRSIE